MTITFAIAPQSLHRLRLRLLAAGPGMAADILEEAGFASGEQLAASWRARIEERTGIDDAGRLDAAWFGPLFDEMCRGLGWGTIAVVPVGGRALLFSSADWAEAQPGSGDQPSCYFTCGCLAAFLSNQAGASLGVGEVECRSKGDRQCRFLAGSAETLATVYDLITAGGGWRNAFGTADLPG
ncbi:MAG: V4R domain-containing protein [Gemmatimonadales bacterium]